MSHDISPDNYSAMKTMDPREILQKEYDHKLPYAFWISSAIVQGEHDLAYEFLKKNSAKKGIGLIYSLS